MEPGPISTDDEALAAIATARQLLTDDAEKRARQCAAECAAVMDRLRCRIEVVETRLNGHPASIDIRYTAL